MGYRSTLYDSESKAPQKTVFPRQEFPIGLARTRCWWLRRLLGKQPIGSCSWTQQQRRLKQIRRTSYSLSIDWCTILTSMLHLHWLIFINQIDSNKVFFSGVHASFALQNRGKLIDPPWFASTTPILMRQRATYTSILTHDFTRCRYRCFKQMLCVAETFQYL